MKVPFSWLKDYIDLKNLTPEEVASRLTIAGLEVVLIEKVGKDSIFDIEVTPNRPDCLSILGIAREAAAALNKKLKPPKAKITKKKALAKLPIEIKDKSLCPRYTGRLVSNITVGKSPTWLTEKLERMDLRPVNNIVDITNFCLFELGQPTHAFDHDKLKGKIIIRRAHKNEKITTIDGKERTLDPDMLVIADEEKPVALGGVMGSKDTEVTEDTKNILFESAYFNPVSIRRTSRRLGLISESSYRFERSVDMGGIVSTSERACSLIKELCGGQIGPLTDKGAKDPKKTKISLRPARLKKILGIDISQARIKKILTSLGLTIESATKTTIVVSAPSFRQDLKKEVDLIEEVIRVYGYDRLPSTMPSIVGHPRRLESSRIISNAARDALIAMGLDEVITYSLMSREDLDYTKEYTKESIIPIKNPLSTEQEIMRPTLIPGMLHAVSWNLNRGAKAVKIFEIGKAYHKEGKSFKEEESLSIALVGKLTQGWQKKDEHSFFELKGSLEALFDRLGIKNVSFKGKGFPEFLTGVAASVEVSGKKIGFLGEIKKDMLDRFDIKTQGYLCEISLQKLFSQVKLEKRFHEMPKFPSAKRDISMVAAKSVSHQDIISEIKKAGGDLVANIELFDQYAGAQIPTGHRGLAYSIEYRAADRTLTDNEVNSLHTEVCNALTQNLQAKIR